MDRETGLSNDFPDFVMYLAMATMVVMAAVLVQKVVLPVASYVQAQSYQGKTDPREVDATSQLKWLDLIHDAPGIPWSYALIINDGPDNVEVAINQPNDRFIVNVGLPFTVDRRGAQERISVLYFICRSGEAAHVRVTGEY